MLTTAAVVTILFRKLKLPVILGYIVAGLLISPYFPMFFGIENMGSINTWSEIGVIVILFHVGLEFDFHKIVDVGSTALVSSAVKMSGVLVCGYGFGKLIGLSHINCLFLGAMLSISSTVVIQKSYEEIDVSGERYPTLVMGSLVMEDVFSIFMMIILSTISASKSVDGLQLTTQLGLMLLYLAIWIVLGIYLLPTFLNRVIEYVSDEMMTVLAIGLCFAMAWLAHELGFSAELGAFIAGSLFAGTMHVERIERITTGIKDVFGAIFFLSVGMMVDPKIIADNWMTIIPIAILAVIVKLIFATIGMVMSGQELETSIKGGISLAPIGEFSFIIAGLGISLGVMEERLYPIIVAASVLTIAFTPLFIKNANRTTALIKRILPNRLLRKIEAYTSSDNSENDRDQNWSIVIKSFFRKTAVYGSVMLAVAMIGVNLIAPGLLKIMPDTWAKVVTCILIYAVVALFVIPFLDFRNVPFTHLWLKSRANRPPLVIIVLLKVMLVAIAVYIPIAELFGFHHMIPAAVVIVALIAFGKTDWISQKYLQVETRFLRNLNEKLLEEEGHEKGCRHWLDEDYSICSFMVPPGCPYCEESLSALSWGKTLDIYVVKIKRGDESFLMPPGDFAIFPGDKVYIVGEQQSLQTFYETLGFERSKPMRTLKEFMETDYSDTKTALSCIAFKVQGIEPYAGKTIRKSGIQEHYKCMILGIQKDGLTIKMPDANLVLSEGDIIWAVGSNNKLGQLAALSAATTEHVYNTSRN